MKPLVLVSLLLLWLPVQAQENGAADAAIVSQAKTLMQKAQQDNIGYEIVESLTTEVGPRLAGTKAEERARDWAVSKLDALGFSNIRVEPFDLPVWQRGIERAQVLAPFEQALTITTLGGSSATGPDGVTASVVSFSTLAELRAAKESQLEGKIVFVDEPMTRTQDGSGYGMGSAKRREAAYIAEKMGAKAVLIRSVGTSNHRFAHTGQMRRLTDDRTQVGVPAAALSAPDADQLQRLLKRGDVQIHLTLTPEIRPAGKSANVIAEVPGTDAADEIVLIGAHLDSWDLGTGAVDDGAGVGIVVAAAKELMDALPDGPRRTIRVVLFGAEEVGLVGAKAYADQHKHELANHIVAAESDFGAGRIWRFDTRVAESKQALTKPIASVLAPLGIAPGKNKASGGPDMTYIREAGVPVVGLIQNGWDYFDLHHTANDTLDKIDPADLSQNVAAYTAFIYMVSEMQGDFRD